MDHYLDIQLLPDPEFTEPILMGALYSKFHRALVTLEATDIGISFPKYQRKPKTLGTILRVHGKRAALDQLQAVDWLKGMRDHTAVTNIQAIPATSCHYSVTRRQYKTNAERLRRRRMKRKGESYEQVVQAIPDTIVRKPDLPFLTLRSSSTGQTFCLFIEQGASQEKPVDGVFNSYGLGIGATVPCF